MPSEVTRMRVQMTEKADSAAETTRREKPSQKPAVSTAPAADAADAVGRREVRRRAMRGIGREGRFNSSGMIIVCQGGKRMGGTRVVRNDYCLREPTSFQGMTRLTEKRKSSSYNRQRGMRIRMEDLGSLHLLGLF